MKKLILMGCLLAVNQVFAEFAAKVLYTQKKVMVSHNGSGSRALIRGGALTAGDQITTEAGASANIQYSNGSLVNIGSNSTYKILAYSPKPSSVQIKAELSHGKVEIQNNGKIKETLKTPIVSLAILGTHINVNVPSAKVTNIQVIEGLVLARNEYLRPGDSVHVTTDSITPAVYPKEGYVNSPMSSAGKIGSTPAEASVNLGIGVESGAEIVTYVATNQLVGSSASSGNAAISMSLIPSLAELSLVCNP